jgi:predicted ribosome quality control (RQC) complex YloA/Tae2 family protein
MIIKKFELYLENKKKFPNFKKMEMDGYEILVGRDAKSNDYITFNIAENDDLWFHVKGYPGSHVILKGDNPTESVIEFAAKSAKEKSKAKYIDNITVVYCERRYVTKKDGMNDGQVNVDYSKTKEINL